MKLIKRDHVRSVGAARTRQIQIDIMKLIKRDHVRAVGAARTQQSQIDIVKALNEITYRL